MVTEQERQAIVDEEHLRLLPITYWVMSCVTAFLALYGLVYVGMGAIFGFASMAETSSSGEEFPLAFGLIFIVLGLGFLILGGVVTALQIMTGVWIRRRRHRIACLVIAGLSCLSVPFGTMIGVFTFITLLRPSVVALFDRPPVPEAPVGSWPADGLS